MPLLPLLLLLCCPSSDASSFFERPFPETVRDASAIVRGKVGKSEVKSVRFPDGTQRVFTYYDVRVTEGLKGAPRTGAPIQIREVGGEKDGVSLQVSGTAEFQPGDDVVVMLGGSAAGEKGVYPVQGMMMGRFSVVKGRDGKEYLEGPGLGSSVHPALRDEQKPAQVSLDGLREIIRTQAKEPSPLPAAPPSPPVAVQTSLVPDNVNPSGVKAVAKEENEVFLESAPPAEESSPFRPMILLIGSAIGVMWFLKSRKNRR